MCCDFCWLLPWFTGFHRKRHFSIKFVNTFDRGFLVFLRIWYTCGASTQREGRETDRLFSHRMVRRIEATIKKRENDTPLTFKTVHDFHVFSNRLLISFDYCYIRWCSSNSFPQHVSKGIVNERSSSWLPTSHLQTRIPSPSAPMPRERLQGR